MKARHLAWLIGLVVLVGCTTRNTPLPTPTAWLTLAPRTTPPPTFVPANATPTGVVARVTSTPVPAQPTTPAALPTATKPGQPMLVQTISIGKLPAPGRNPSGVAAVDGLVYVCNRSSDNVSILENGAVRQVVPVGRAPSAAVADPASKRVFVLNEEAGSVSVLQASRVVATWTLPEKAVALAVVNDQLWAGSWHNGLVMVLSLQDGSKVAQLTVPDTLSILNLVTAPDGRRVYVNAYGQLHVVDVASRQVLTSIKLNTYRVLAIAPTGQRVYTNESVAETQQNYLAVLEAETLRVVQRIPMPDDLAVLLTDPRNGRIYAISSYTNELIVVDGDSYQCLAVMRVGRAPRSMALDVQASRLYVANDDGDNLSIVDTSTLALLDVAPLAMHFGGLDFDPLGGKLYIAASSSDRVLAWNGARLADPWVVRGYPTQIRALSAQGAVAVLSLVDMRLAVLDSSGKATASYATGRDPRGLAWDEPRQRLLAGDLALDWQRQSTQTVRIATAYNSVQPPVQIVRDTRRDRLYAVSFNGYPGSSGGNSITPLDAQLRRSEGSAPARISVVGLLYDEEMDHLYTTSSRMGSSSLLISQAEDSRDLLSIPLERYPAAMVLNPATRHLWLALHPPLGSNAARDSVIMALDTRTLTPVITLTVEGLVESLAVDPRENRVFLGNGDLGSIQIIQDVIMPAPAQAAATYTPALPTPVAPKAVATVAAAPTCVATADDRLRAAWEAGGGAAGLGCAFARAVESDWVAQPFEHGRMLWRSDIGTIFILRDDGQLQTFHDDWQAGQPPQGCEASPPAGLQQPVRGFGLVWCRERGVREGLGWAQEAETAFRGVYQIFERGALMLGPEGKAYALYTDGRWKALNP